MDRQRVAVLGAVATVAALLFLGLGVVVGRASAGDGTGTADGDTKLRNRNVPAGIPAPNINWDAEATIKLPDTAIVSLVHDLNSRWQLLADVSWTGWSSIPRLTIENSGPGAKNSGLELKFKDAWRVALGANYHYNNTYFAQQGYAVVTLSARGFGRSCGVPESRTAGCERGWTHVADHRFENRDTQHLLGLLQELPVFFRLCCQLGELVVRHL